MSHDLRRQPQRLLHPVLAFALAVVAGLQPQMAKTREPFAHPFEQRLDPVSVHDVGRVDLRLEQKALRIDKNVALSALDLLAPIVAALFSSHAGVLYRLGIDYPGRGLRISPQARPKSLSEGGVQPLPSALQAPEILK